MENIVYDVAIVGGGIAGFEAALTLQTLRRSFLWIGAKKFGEKISLAENVSNFAGFTGSGTELLSRLEAHAAREEIPFLQARIDGIYPIGEGFTLASGEKMYRARAVILASGVENAHSCAGEREFLGRGVSYCAVCDGALYRGKNIAVILSLKEFEEEAEYLAGFAKEVYAFCLFQGASFRAKNIRIVPDVPVSIRGNARVEAICTEGEEIAVDGVFFLKNSTPPAALCGGLKTAEDGHVLVGRDMSTNLKGLFAAGDVTGRPYQYMKAAGEGLVAAFSAASFVKNLF